MKGSDGAVAAAGSFREDDDSPAGGKQRPSGHEIAPTTDAAVYRKPTDEQPADGSPAGTREPVVGGGRDDRPAPDRRRGEQRHRIGVRRVVGHNHARAARQFARHAQPAGAGQHQPP